MNADDRAKINGLMQRYFDGLYHSDSQVLRTVFHPELSYVNATPGTHEFLDLEAYMTRIDNRTPPASRNDPRAETIQNVTLKGGQIGMVEAEMMMIGRNYQDLLTIIRTGDEWAVLTKVFTYVEKEN